MATIPSANHEEHDDHALHNQNRKKKEFVPTSLFEVVMYLIFVGLIVGIAVVLNAGFEQAASMITRLLGA